MFLNGYFYFFNLAKLEKIDWQLNAAILRCTDIIGFECEKKSFEFYYLKSIKLNTVLMISMCTLYIFAEKNNRAKLLSTCIKPVKCMYIVGALPHSLMVSHS